MRGSVPITKAIDSKSEHAQTDERRENILHDKCLTVPPIGKKERAVEQYSAQTKEQDRIVAEKVVSDAAEICGDRKARRQRKDYGKEK